MKRAAGITGWYAVRLTYSAGWALYKHLPQARMRATFEGHGFVTYMTSADADTLRLKEVVV